MKRSILLLLTLALVLSPVACVSVKVADSPFDKGEPAPAVTEVPKDVFEGTGETHPGSDSEEPEPRVTEAPSPEPTAEPTPEPTAEPTPEPTPESTVEPTPAPTETPEPEPTEVPFAAVEAAANEKLRAVQSFHMDVDMTLDMEMALAVGEIRQSIPVDVTLALGMDVIQEPLLIRAQMTVSAVETTTDGLIYGAGDVEHTVIYTSLDKGATWQKRTDPEGEQMLSAPGEAMTLLLGENVDLQQTGTEEVGGRPAVVYAGKLDGQRLREIFESTGALEGMSEALALELPETALADRQDMDVQVMIDEESGLPVRYRVDMAAALQYFMAAVLQESMAGEDMEGAELQMDVASAWLEVTLSDFDAVAPFAIPEAALNAPEA